jgi:aldehyde dehydrogenase (NAD+)
METITLTHHIAARRVSGLAAFEQTNPADPGDLRISGPEADGDIVAEAVAAARAALPVMSGIGIERRADALAHVAQTLRAQVERLALLIARETGKTLSDSQGETLRAARLFDFFAGETLRNVGERFDSVRRGSTVEVIQQPVGVVGAITPWNFPIAIPAWKLAPALAFGNTVVWKPSEISSGTAGALMEIIASAGLPPGAVNMVLGAGPAGRALAEADGIDAITFTGSTTSGASVRMAAARQAVRCQLEMGGVNGLIVLADADLPLAVDCALNGAFFAAGQRCTATSRIIVEQTIADRFVEALTARMAELIVGDPRHPATQVGPLASPRQKEIVTGLVEQLEATGLSAVIGGTGARMEACFFAPTLYDHAPESSLLGTDEIFGPVAGVFRVGGFDEALALLNATPHGLSAGLCTTSLKHAEAFKKDARAGMTMVNLPTAGVDYHAPFGGVGASSYGMREQGRAARSFYTTMKTAYQFAG